MVVVRRLIWEKTNTDHVARHHVTPQEVEQVCHGKYITFDVHHGRYMIVGSTLTKRILAIIIDPEPKAGVYYPVTARTADKKEKQAYSTKWRL